MRSLDLPQQDPKQESFADMRHTVHAVMVRGVQHISLAQKQTQAQAFCFLRESVADAIMRHAGASCPERVKGCNLILRKRTAG